MLQPSLLRAPGSPGQAGGRQGLGLVKLAPLPGNRTPYLDGPQPRMLRLKGHNLGRVRDVEKHVEALILL